MMLSVSVSGAVVSSPALRRDGTVFVGSDDGHLFVLNPDGSLRLACPVGSPVRSSPLIGPDGMAYFGSLEGNFYAIPARTTFADGPWPMLGQNYRRTGNAKTLILRPGFVTATNTYLLEISGPAGSTCAIEMATNLNAPWLVFTNVALATGQISLITQTGTSPHQFYRARFTD